jgi:RHH-type transcriptional regulator, rel operon repressor / antitoxin RelB
VLAVQLPPEIEERLEALAKRTGKTTTDFVREAILDQIDDLEDLHLAEQAWLDHQASGEPTIPLEDMLKQHGVAV